MKTETRPLLVLMTDEEKRIRATQLGNVLLRIDDKRAEIKEVMRDMKLDLAGLEKEKGELAAAVRTGSEYREVECTLTPRGNVWEISRNDTGEVIDSRVMDEDERQISFEDER